MSGASVAVGTTGGTRVVAEGVVPQRLRPPKAVTPSLTRRRLLDRVLDAGSPVVVLAAGAGYGKTSLLRDWVDCDERRAGWVSLDRTDDDPVVLVRHLAHALGSCGVDVAGLDAALSRREPQFDRDVLPALATSLEHASHSFLLVLDDVHVVTARPSLELLEELLDMVPSSSTVALAARQLPPLRLARRALDGSVTELTGDDLAFDEDEARAVARAELPGLQPDQERDLVAFARGWPAGLHLAAMALRDHPDPNAVLRTLVAGDQRVAGYLHEEVLDRLDPPTRRFLVRSAVLDRLSPAVCDAVLERDDSAASIEQLIRSGNSFVLHVGLGDEIRLHDLFRDILLADLRRSDPPAEAQLRGRAAEWYDRRGAADEAVDQAVATGDPDFAARMLYRQLFHAVLSGRVSALGRWLELFSPDQIRDDGLVALCAGWHALLSGSAVELTHHLDHARSARVTGSLPDGTCSFEVAVAALEMVAALDGTGRVYESARLVLDAGPGGSPWEGLATFFAAISEGLMGRAELVDSLSRAEVATRGMPSVHVVCQAQLGWSLLRGGSSMEGQAWVERAEAEMEEHDLGEFAPAAPVHGVVSYASSLRHDEAGSLRAAERAEAALCAMRHLVPRGRLHTRLLLAAAALHRGQVAEARRQLDQCADLLVLERDAVVLGDWARQLRQSVEQADRLGGVVELTPAEQRVLEQLPTHRSLVEIGEHLYVSRNTVKTHTLSIYRKLAVSSRSEAVASAITLGLLPGTSDR